MVEHDDDPAEQAARAPVQVDPDAAEASLAAVVERLGGVAREGQVAMVRAVAAAISAGEHLLAAAPTGTGKTLGYAVPAALAAGERPVLLSTATKALQQQLVDVDLPALAEVVPGLEVAVLKGRGEYVCRAATAQLTVTEPLFDAPVDPDAWEALTDWAGRTRTGDRADAPDGITDVEWRGVSVTAGECPGRSDCSFGAECFAELARDRARSADLVVANHHLVLFDALAGGWILPEHAVLCLDEAHKLVDIASSALGMTLHPKRLTDLAGRAEAYVEVSRAERLREVADRLVAVLGDRDPERPLEPEAEPLAGVLDALKGAVGDLARTLGAARAEAAGSPTPPEHLDALTRTAKMATTLLSELDLLVDVRAQGRVAFVEVLRRSRALRVAPIEVGALLAELLFARRTVIATSATLAVGGRLEPTAAALGLDGQPWRGLQVPSPFDHARNALLYVPRDAPDPRQPGYEQVALDTTLALIEAADGRSLLLFTSWARLHRTAEWLEGRLPEGVDLLVQGRAPPRRLLERYVADERSVLLGVASFWEGISAPGTASVNVIVDKLPFARRGDPLLDARRQAAEATGGDGFTAVDLPHAAIALAQGVGRLIRTVEDFGCIAVLDARLARSTYRTVLLDSLPAARRTVNLHPPAGLELPDDPDERLTLLEQIRGGPPVTAWLRTRLAQAGR